MKRRRFIKSLTVSGGMIASNASGISVWSSGLFSLENTKVHESDVVIYGGTSGGFTAAVQLAKMGKKVVLLEPTGHIGGINVEGLGASDIDNHPEFQDSIAIGGLALAFYRRIARVYDRVDDFDKAVKNHEKNHSLWCFEPHAAEKVILDWLKEYRIDFHTFAALPESRRSVEIAGGRIASILTRKGKFKARVFIDATIEGDLIAAAGIDYSVGREPNAEYGESRNGIIGYTTHSQFRVQVDPYKIPGDSKSGLIPTIQSGPLGVPGSGDHRLQAYCFRPCLTRDPQNRIPFERPSNYDRGQYEIYLRYLKAGGKLYRPSVNLPNGKVDLNGGGDLSHNLYGMNYEYPDGNRKARARVVAFHKEFTQGLFYFLSNDLSVRQLNRELQEDWASWGLAGDEFSDNHNWPRQLYVRDARRMKSDYVITELHARKEGGTAVEDPVAVTFWPPDLHNVRRIVVDDKAYNEGAVFGGNWWKPFGISYRSLVPKQGQCSNLLTPTCPSSSHIAYGAIRIEWTFMALGQSVGTAAVLALDHDIAVQQVDYRELKGRLLADNQVLAI